MTFLKNIYVDDGGCMYDSIEEANDNIVEGDTLAVYELKEIGTMEVTFVTKKSTKKVGKK